MLKKKVSVCLVLVIFLTVIVSYTANAYIYYGCKWPINNAVYKYTTAVPSDWQTAIYNAAAYTWNGNSKFSLYYSSSASNVWGAANYGAYSGTVGITSVRYNGSTISGVNTDFNTYYSFSTSPSSSQYDVQTIALHEFGHWLDLSDEYSSDCSANVMYGYSSPGATKRSLTTDDINGIVSIYGK